MNALFVNGSSQEACGVNQYGKNLYSILSGSKNIQWSYCAPDNIGQLRAAASFPSPAVVLYNFQQGQNTFLSDSPFPWLEKQYCCYHDLAINEDRFSGIFFSDPTMTPRGKWIPMGRPLPAYSGSNTPGDGLIVGVHGFIGAWADQVVHKVIGEFEHATIRLNLPYATYGDANGDAARSMADRCRSMLGNNPGITLEVSHNFLPIEQLLTWLASNTINVYIRPTNWNWRGVSSAPDSAIAVKRPIAVNRCNAFRHLHNLEDSICVEDRSLMDIIGSGLSPTTKLRAEWSPENIRSQVEDVLLKL